MASNSTTYGKIGVEVFTSIMPFEAICQHCNNSFSVRKRSELLSRKYCSAKCSSASKLKPRATLVEKLCPMCKTVKPASDFQPTKKTSDGLLWNCRKCSIVLRERRAAKIQPVEEKKCLDCELVKPAKDFSKQLGGIGNLQSRCRPCASVFDKSRRAKPEVKERNRVKATERYRKYRDDLLNAYGNRCACCGESTPEFLAVDHIQNDGAAHRKAIGSTNISWWLRKNNYPQDGFQLLCHNCNLAKGFYGVCPHQRGGQDG